MLLLHTCGSDCPTGGRIALMPEAIPPQTGGQGFLFSASDSGFWARGGISSTDHYLTIWTANGVKSIIQDGVVYTPDRGSCWHTSG